MKKILLNMLIYDMEAAKRRYICMLTRLRDMYFEMKSKQENYIIKEYTLEDDAIQKEIANLSKIEETAAENKA